MVSYVGRHAALYDIIYGEKPYAREAAFVDECLKKYGIGSTPTLLEVACGTGSHAFALEKLGYKIIATDYSEDMLACARRKAADFGSSTEFRWQDMRELNVEERPFDGVICLFDSIGYVQTNEALIQVFEGVNRHLRSDGLFVFEFWHAAAMLSRYERVRVRRWSLETGELVRIAETELDCEKQLAKVSYTIYELHGDGKCGVVNETITNRYFLVQEMAGWLTFCGFVPLGWFAGFTSNESITQDAWHIVAVARKVTDPYGVKG